MIEKLFDEFDDLMLFKLHAIVSLCEQLYEQFEKYS